MVLLRVMVSLKVTQIPAVKTTVLQRLVQLSGSKRVFTLTTKRKNFVNKMAGTGVEVNRNPDGSVGLIMQGNITLIPTNQTSNRTSIQL